MSTWLGQLMPVPRWVLLAFAAFWVAMLARERISRWRWRRRRARLRASWGHDGLVPTQWRTPPRLNPPRRRPW